MEQDQLPKLKKLAIFVMMMDFIGQKIVFPTIHIRFINSLEFIQIDQACSTTYRDVEQIALT